MAQWVSGSPARRTQGVVREGHVVGADVIAVSPDGSPYVSINQLPRSLLFNGGTDDRIPPYRVVRVPVKGQPVRLR